MSGHSKWSNIKNRKGAQDKKRSAVFTKVSKNILTAIRTGVGLKAAIDKAREVNMPNENVERLIAKFEERKASLVLVTLEGYGPFGIPIIIQLETDNKNRVLGEIKLIFRNYDGNLGGVNSAMFQFERAGEMLIPNNPIVLNSEDEVVKIMDMIEELEENDDVINVFAGFDYKKV